METLIGPSPGVSQAVLGIFAVSNPWGDRALLDTAERLGESLSEDEISHLGEAIGAILPLLRYDPDRFHFALDFILAFDIWEAAEALVELLRKSPEPHLTLVAGAFAGHPGVSNHLREFVQLTSGLVDLEEPQTRLLSLLLDPTLQASSEAEALAQSERWLGKTDLRSAVRGPAVVIHDSAGTPSERWNLAIDIKAYGALVRRLPLTFSAPEVQWMGPDVPVVIGSWNDADLLKRSGLRIEPDHLVVAPMSTRGASRHVILSEIDATLPAGRRLRIGTTHRQVISAPEVLDPEVFVLGAFDSSEIAFLSGIRRSTIRYLKNEQALLPKKVRGLNYWTFNQLCGIRMWQFFRQQTKGGRLSPTVARTLVSYADSKEARIVGVTGAGNVFVRDGEHVVDVETNQLAPEELVALDNVFNPISLGGGRTIPHLLEPSSRTRVHPTVNRGTPTIVFQRIPARAVHLAFVDGTRSGGNGTDRVQDLYPELSVEDIEDAAQVGARLQGTP